MIPTPNYNFDCTCCIDSLTMSCTHYNSFTTDGTINGVIVVLIICLIIGIVWYIKNSY